MSKKEKSLLFKESFTTLSGGYFCVCVKNKYSKRTKGKKDSKKGANKEESNENEEMKVSFLVKHGIAAKDYSEVSTLKTLKPVELAVSKHMILFESFKLLNTKVKNCFICLTTVSLMKR